jgi:hypothetical protein
MYLGFSEVDQLKGKHAGITALGAPRCGMHHDRARITELTTPQGLPILVTR